MTGCVFCKFVASPELKKEQVIFEDELVYCMLDDYPISRGHTLVILKEHRLDLASVGEDEAAHLGIIVARVAAALKKALGVEFVYVVSVGEQVQHVHCHLIPRYKKDRKGFVHFTSRRGALENPYDLANRIKEFI